MTKKRKDFLVFGMPEIDQDEIDEVVSTLQSGWLSTGPRVQRFEEDFKRYIGCKHAISMNSCTAGLHLSLLLGGVKPGDEVITTPLTFASTANTIVHVGAKPVFVDVDPETRNIDPSKIEEAITPKTKAIVPVHLNGRPCEMDEITEIGEKHDLMVSEDAAHALEARYKGKKIGTISQATSFSFYVTKNITTGEGGMVTTNDDELADRLQVYRLHGLSKSAWKRYISKGFMQYEVLCPGYKYNMTDLQAALGIRQLEKVDRFYKERKSLWKKYNDALRYLPIETPSPIPKDIVHAMHLYTILVDLDKLDADRNGIQGALQKENIGTGIHFISLHLHKYYRETFGYKRGDFPHAERISDRTISIPFSQYVSEEDSDDVIAALTHVLNRYKK